MGEAGSVNTLRTVHTPFRYADETKPAGVLYALAHGKSTCSFRAQETVVFDGRPVSDQFSLVENGFVLVPHRTRVTDFEDRAQVDSIYVPEVQSLVSRLTGASHVIVFHKLARFEGGESRGKRQPARNPHIDYTEESFRVWVKQELGEEQAAAVLKKRWAAINVWRGIRTVERAPLAIADGRTIAPDHLLAVPIHERPGEPTPFVGLNVTYDPGQRWYYFPNMRPDEALVFTLFDSDSRRVQRVAHSAFDDPASPEGAPGRASFEVRTVAFFE